MTSWPGEGDGSGAAGSGAQAPPLDDVDRAIAAVLRENGRISMRALAARLHISRSGAYLRVQRLEEAGVITGYYAWVDPQRYGYALSAYVHLKITAAWRLATCFPAPSSRPVYPRSPRPRRSSGPLRGRPHHVAGGGGGTSSCEIWWAQLGSNQ
jgi:hypothetical protein